MNCLFLNNPSKQKKTKMAKQVQPKMMEKEISLNTNDADTFDIDGATSAFRFKLNRAQENVLQIGVKTLEIPAAFSFFDSLHKTLDIQYGLYSNIKSVSDTDVYRVNSSFFRITIDLDGGQTFLEDRNMEGMVNYLNYAIAVATGFCQYTSSNLANTPPNTSINRSLPWFIQTSEDSIALILYKPTSTYTNFEDLLVGINTGDMSIYSMVKNINQTDEEYSFGCFFLSLTTYDSLSRSLGYLDDDILIGEAYSLDQKAFFDENFPEIKYGSCLTATSSDDVLVPRGTAASGYTAIAYRSEIKELYYDTSQPINMISNTAPINPQISYNTGATATTTPTTEFSDIEIRLYGWNKDRKNHGAIYASYGTIPQAYENYGVPFKLTDLRNYTTQTLKGWVFSLSGKEAVRVNHGLDSILITTNDLPISQSDVIGANNPIYNQYNVLTEVALSRTELISQNSQVDTNFAFSYLPLEIPRNKFSEIIIGFVAYLGKKNKYKFVTVENVSGLKIVLKIYKEYKGP